MTAKAPIIVVKKKGGHGGHHGGAWKVAYADFVTAMMALFIVLWLMNSSKKIQEGVGGYFKDPSGTSNKTSTDKSGAGDNFVVTKDNMEQLMENLQKAIRQVPNFDNIKSQIEMTVTNEGLRIELLESDKGTFFDSGSAKINADNEQIIIALAEHLGKLPNQLSIEGHTDAKAFGKTASYGNWELSADRANSARRLMQANGIREDQVAQVRGFADQRLRKPDSPLDPANRRISLIVQYLEKKIDEDDKPKIQGPAAEAKRPAAQSAKPAAAEH
jgi:chemotaxis protein MotB